MTKAPRRHTHVAERAIDPTSATDLMKDFDLDGARVAVEALTDLQNNLRMTPSRTRAQRRKRRDLIEQARAQEQYLKSVNVQITTQTADAPERKRAQRSADRRFTVTRRIKAAMTFSGIVTFIALAIYGVVALASPDPKNVGRYVTETLEVIARGEARYASRNNGQFTETIDKLLKIEKETNGKFSYAYELLKSAEDYNIIAQNNQFHVTHTARPRFSLRRNSNGTFTATCDAEPEYGCRNRTWTPASDLAIQP